LRVANLLFFATINSQDAVDILADLLWYRIDRRLIRSDGMGGRSIHLISFALGLARLCDLLITEERGGPLPETRQATPRGLPVDALCRRNGRRVDLG
jgi:hypothetical protein